MQKVLIKNSEIATLKNGGCVVGVDVGTFNKVKIALSKEGNAHIVATTKAAYTGVNPSPLFPATDLNLTTNETLEGMKGALETIKDSKAFKYVVYRSSGALDKFGKPLTREQQIQEGKARAITITCCYIDGNNKNPNSYRWAISQDNTTELLEQVEYIAM